MKVAIPVEEKSLHSNVCVSFGRTPYFLIYDTETNESRYIDNAAAGAQGGAGIKAAQSVIDVNAAAVITVRLGQNSADVLNAAGVKLYQSEFGSVKRNIELLTEGKLSVLTSFHAGFHGIGGIQ